MNIDDIVAAARELDLPFSDALVSFAKPALLLELTNTTEPCPPLGSRLGGQPCLPKTTLWPRKDGKPLSCVGQLNLSEIAQVRRFDELPRSGLLTFFYDAESQPWGLEPSDRGSFCVQYIPELPLDMHLTPWPEDLPEVWRFCDAAVRYHEILTLPSADSRQIANLRLGEEQFEAYEQLLSQISDALNQGGRSLVLGHPDQIQMGDLFDGLPLVTAGIPIGSAIPDNARVRELHSKAKDWRLLFQVESLDASNMIWGSEGCLYFCIREEDLRRQEFNSSWIALQCS